MVDTANEKNRIAECAQHAQYSKGVMQKATAYCGEIFRRFMIPGRVLELGPAEGVMTDILSPYFTDYTVVDGADVFVDAIRRRHDKVQGYTSLFEDFVPDGCYDNIILGHVLEHVAYPADILKRCGSWLAQGGRIIAAVPNANSIHRQIGVRLGMLASVHQLNEADRRSGHRRVYDIDMLQNDFVSAGLTILKSGGYYLKPLSNEQIENMWTDDMIRAFFKIGEKYPDVAGEIYIVATRI